MSVEMLESVQHYVRRLRRQARPSRRTAANEAVPDIVLSLLGAGEPLADDDLNARVKSYYGSIKMLYLYEVSDKLSDEGIFREYIEKGEDSARELVDNSYAEMFNSDSEVAKTYAEVLREANSAYLAQLVKYAGVGCISKENGLDRKCVGLKIPYDDDTKNYEKMSQKVYKMYNSTVSEITNECWNISEAINKNGEES